MSTTISNEAILVELCQAIRGITKKHGDEEFQRGYDRGRLDYIIEERKREEARNAKQAIRDRSDQ